MHIKFSIFEINTKFRYNLAQLVEFENSTDVKKQKCRTAYILLLGFITYSILATLFATGGYEHGKVTNLCIALLFGILAYITRRTQDHIFASLVGSYGISAILFFHFITEVDWTIGMDAFWLFILIMPFITNYLSGVVYGSISALSGLFLSLILFHTDMKYFLQPYGQNMLDWFSVIYIVAMIAAAFMEYELTCYQIEKKISDEKITYFQIERNQRLREQLSIYENNESTIRKYKHDIRHFNRVLAGFIKNNEYDKAKEYLKELDSMLEQVTAVSFCDNKIVNELLTIYVSRCQKLGFKLRAKAVVPERFPMEELELTSLVANILENALEAQEKAPKEKRFIQIEIIYDGRKLKLQSKNYCPSALSFNKEGLPISTKTIQSGIGTAQIRSIAQKYSGFASFTQEGDVLIVKAAMTCQ